MTRARDLANLPNDDLPARVAAIEESGAGAKIRHIATGTPDPSLGEDGDQCIVDDTGDLFNKVDGAWVFALNIVGPAGPAGPQGDAGPQGPQGLIGPAGADGADGANVTITVAADQAAFDAASPGATELVVLYA